jgi:hypothetical protein
VRLLGAFVLHELRVQVRSLRFRLLVILYLVGCIAPPVVLLFVSRRRPDLITGPSGFFELTKNGLPGLSALLALALSLDGITRERDGQALLVVALAPVSSTGYVVRRWLAISAVVLGVSLAGPFAMLTCAAIADALPLPLVPCAGQWLLDVVPATLGCAALGLGLGTLCGHPVMALLCGTASYALAFSAVNSLLARRRTRPSPRRSSGSASACRKRPSCSSRGSGASRSRRGTSSAPRRRARSRAFSRSPSRCSFSPPPVAT